MDSIYLGIRDGSFLPQHGSMLNAQMQPKFLRSRLGSALAPRDDMHTAAQLQRELRFRQHHDPGAVGRFRNVSSAL